MEDRADADDAATERPIGTQTRVPTEESDEDGEVILPRTRAA
ncbi:MAG: hypothetical protein A07HR67_01798 [uncultured archaeon A07HR67]|nr:MAG: hypothetical protein A07HR67_01798 [uncultured archaeon A07HR67]